MTRGNVSLGLTLNLAIAENITALCVRYSLDRVMDRAVHVLPPMGTDSSGVKGVARTDYSWVGFDVGDRIGSQQNRKVEVRVGVGVIVTDIDRQILFGVVSLPEWNG
jgi:hypothetical protein